MSTTLEPMIPMDFNALSKSGSCLFLDLLKQPSSLVNQERNGDNEWLACVLWNSKVLQEFQVHEEIENKLYTRLSLGRLMCGHLQQKNQKWPGREVMDWKAHFVMVDIIGDQLSKCGYLSSLRVQETPTGSTKLFQGKSRLWDLVIYDECKLLISEIIRKRHDGVKTTLMIWGAYRDTYTEPWFDRGDYVMGEIFMKSTNDKNTPLSVLIFHHEKISVERRKLIQEASCKSELWSSFQDRHLDCKWFSNSSIDETELHFSVHVIKHRKRGSEVVIDQEADTGDMQVASFPDSPENESIANYQNRSLTDLEIELLFTQERGGTDDEEEEDGYMPKDAGATHEVSDSQESLVPVINWGDKNQTSKNLCKPKSMRKKDVCHKMGNIIHQKQKESQLEENESQFQFTNLLQEF